MSVTLGLGTAAPSKVSIATYTCPDSAMSESDAPTDLRIGSGWPRERVSTPKRLRPEQTAPFGRPTLHPAGMVDMALRRMPDGCLPNSEHSEDWKQREAAPSLTVIAAPSLTVVDEDLLHGLNPLSDGDDSFGGGLSPPCTTPYGGSVVPEDEESLRSVVAEMQQSLSGLFQHVSDVGREVRELSSALEGHKMEQTIAAGNMRYELINVIRKEEEKVRSQLAEEHENAKDDLMQLAERVNTGLNTVSQLLAKERDMRMNDIHTLEMRVQNLSVNFESCSPDSKLARSIGAAVSQGHGTPGGHNASESPVLCQNFRHPPTPTPASFLSFEGPPSRTSLTVAAGRMRMPSRERMSSPERVGPARLGTSAEVRRPSPPPAEQVQIPGRPSPPPIPGRLSPSPPPTRNVERVTLSDSRQTPLLSVTTSQHASLGQRASIRSLPGTSSTIADKSQSGYASVRSLPGLTAMADDHALLAQSASQSSTTCVRSLFGASLVSDAGSSDRVTVSGEHPEPANRTLLLSPGQIGRPLQRPPIAAPLAGVSRGPLVVKPPSRFVSRGTL